MVRDVCNQPTHHAAQQGDDVINVCVCVYMINHVLHAGVQRRAAQIKQPVICGCVNEQRDAQDDGGDVAQRVGVKNVLIAGGRCQRIL